jgi:hypothetical protein
MEKVLTSILPSSNSIQTGSILHQGHQMQQAHQKSAPEKQQGPPRGRMMNDGITIIEDGVSLVLKLILF